MRAPVVTFCLLFGLMAGCSFDPKIPKGSLLCKGPNSPECPRGYRCEQVDNAAWKNVYVCCNQPGCGELTPVDINRIMEARNRAADAGSGPDGGAATDSGIDAPPTPTCGTCGDNMVEAACGEKCDPVGSCPTMCTSDGCKKRKLVNAGGCQAECVDDGMETECVGGDSCCPAGCDATKDSDCRATCGNMALEAGETCDPGDTCPTSCPAIGCTLQKLEGSSRTCDAKCVESGKQMACVTGDSCCPMGCTATDDRDCECVCGNGTVESICGEMCDPLGSCPTVCPPMGCQLRKLVNAGSCQAQCVNDGTQTACMNGDGCCPGGCNATNDSDCTVRCGNGAVETGETCDPPSKCPRSCPWNGCGRRKLEGSADACTARCVDDGTQTTCASGDGCCPSSCNSTNDNDCSVRCGNGVREGNEKCDGADCPASCPAMGCQRRKLQGSAAQCTAECVDDSVITACTNGDGCCASGCTSVNDNDCSVRCGNGVREGNEKCDGADCPTTCPAMGCQRRRLLGTAAQCTAECVNDGLITMCMNGDACCPASGCNRNTDNNCPAVCGNGAIEMGESCDPTAMCMTQSQMCTSDRNTIRMPSGMVANCTFRCTQTPRACLAASDGQCPVACAPCGASCTAGQDIDCKLDNGATCTHANQCMNGACTTFFRDMDVDGRGGAAVQVCGTTAPSGTITTGGDCCDTDNRVFAGQTNFFPSANNCMSFDYNCSGGGERRFVIEEECNQDACLSGWRGAVPACGASGTFRSCRRTGPGVGFCDIQPDVSQPQPCR